MPVMVLNSVVFPAPLGPIREKISPCRMSKLTSPTAVRPPKRLVTPATRSDTARSGLATLRPIAQVEDRLLDRALLKLLLADPAREQPLRSQQHDHHQDQSKDKVVQANDLVMQPDPIAVGLVQKA